MTRVLVTEKIHASGLRMLREQFDVDVTLNPTPATLKEMLPRYEALLVRSSTQVTADVLDAGNHLRVVGRAGAGVDNIDVEAATRAGIVVVNAPSANSVAVAELVFGMLLSLARHIPQAQASLREGRWDRAPYMGWELRGKTLGLLGCGRIGAEVASRARAFDMQVLACDPALSLDRAQQLGIQAVGLEQLLSDSDIVSVHTPLLPSTRNLLDAARLRQIKRGAFLINCARGGIVDETALLAALDSEQVAGAVLDVWANEPPLSQALVQHPRVLGLPHLGASTAEAQAHAAYEVAQGVIDVLSHRTPRNAANCPTLDVLPARPIALYSGVRASAASIS
jgi:D-3-phosphoglycerate dehydrogenase